MQSGDLFFSRIFFFNAIVFLLQFKGWRSSAVTTLGMGGSDLTATTLGKALGLREIQVAAYSYINFGNAVSCFELNFYHSFRRMLLFFFPFFSKL